MSPLEDKRFRFGRNWRSYSERVDNRDVQTATRSIIDLVGTLDGSTFLDVGSGSGLFSLAALQAGAKEVLAFDYDPDSVETTRHVLEQHAPHDGWIAVRGDAWIVDGSRVSASGTSYTHGESCTAQGTCGTRAITSRPSLPDVGPSSSLCTTTRTSRAASGR